MCYSFWLELLRYRSNLKSGRKWGREKHYRNILYKKYFQLKKGKKTTIKETQNDAIEPVNVTRPGPSLSSAHWTAGWACQHIKDELSSSQKKKKNLCQELNFHRSLVLPLDNLALGGHNHLELSSGLYLRGTKLGQTVHTVWSE